MTDVLLVFVKAPRPGQAKTRLAAVLGAELAADLARAMAERVVERTRPAARGYTRVFFHSPPEAAEEIAAWLGEGPPIAQSAGDLGARMAAAFSWAFDRAARRVVLIGTDTPGLGREDVLAALEALDAADLVVGPSLDGGYYLIGLSRPCPAVFEGVPWSTPSVLGETLARAEALELRVRPLAVRGDIDTVEDLRREWPALVAWLAPELMRRLERVLQD